MEPNVGTVAAVPIRGASAALKKKLGFAPPFDFEKKNNYEAVLRVRVRIDFGRLDPDPGGLKKTETDPDPQHCFKGFVLDPG
jgi:hypothetical protein